MAKVYYRPIGQEMDVFLKAHSLNIPVLLKGPTGCGKTRFVEAAAERLNTPLITVSCHEETSATDLVGRHLLIGGETVFLEGPLIRALRQGAILYLDEIAEARADVLVVLHSVTDYRRQLYVERTGETVYASPGFQVVASFNPGYQRGQKEMKPSTRQRFIAMNFTYPTFDAEIEIVEHESGLERKLAKCLVNLGNQIRNLKQLGLMETVSTRLLLEAARLIQGGVTPRTACQVAIVEPLTDELEDRLALSDLVAMQF